MALELVETIKTTIEALKALYGFQRFVVAMNSEDI